LSNKNENATVAKFKKFFQLNKASAATDPPLTRLSSPRFPFTRHFQLSLVVLSIAGLVATATATATSLHPCRHGSACLPRCISSPLPPIPWPAINPSSTQLVERPTAHSLLYGEAHRETVGARRPPSVPAQLLSCVPCLRRALAPFAPKDAFKPLLGVTLYCTRPAA